MLSQFSERITFNVQVVSTNVWSRPGWNQGFHTFHRTSLPTVPSLFKTRKLKIELFVCKYVTYFQSLIYFQTELLTPVKFSRHVWTGFQVVVPQVMESGPITKVCKYNHQKFKEYSSVSGFADTTLVV